jgi:tetratricopeptide (TPR) repeat protein
MLTLGTRIRELRLKKGMTQIDLSKDLCTPSMISQIESDRARPSYKILFEISKKFEVTLDKLLVNVELDLEHLSTFKMAQAMIAAKEHKAALPLLLSVQEHPNTNVSQTELLYTIGLCQYHTGDLEGAEESFAHLLQFDTEQEPFETIPSALLMLGMISHHKKNLPIAMHQWMQGLEQLRALDGGDPALEVELLTRVAQAHFECGNVAEAISLYEDLVARYGDAGQVHELADIHRRLGDSYRRLGQHAKAIYHLEQAITLYKTMKFQHSLLQVRRQHAILQGEKGNVNEAVALLQEVVVEFERDGDEEAEGSTLVVLGKLAHEKGDLDLSLRYAERAQQLLPLGHPDTGDLYRLLAVLHFAHEEDEEGIVLLRQAIQSFRQHNKLHELEQTTQELCDALMRTRSFEIAFKELLGTHELIIETLHQRGILL